jgi:tuftelin-interacting protein 11
MADGWEEEEVEEAGEAAPERKRAKVEAGEEERPEEEAGDSSGAAAPEGVPEGAQPPQPKLSFAERMMAKLGHVAGMGLGKAAQGIVEPIKESSQVGRAGRNECFAGREIGRERDRKRETGTETGTDRDREEGTPTQMRTTPRSGAGALCVAEREGGGPGD